MRFGLSGGRKPPALFFHLFMLYPTIDILFRWCYVVIVRTVCVRVVFYIHLGGFMAKEVDGTQMESALQTLNRELNASVVMVAEAEKALRLARARERSARLAAGRVGL